MSRLPTRQVRAAALVLASALGLVGCNAPEKLFDGCSTSNLGACPSSEGYANPYEGQLELLSWSETLRKASLELTGKLPTDRQVQVTREQGQRGLEAALAEMMRDEAFLNRLKEIYNDHFLTDKYLGRRNAVDLLSEDVFPNLRWFGDNDDLGLKSNDSIAREPLELIAYVVRNERPFTEILTANYTVANGYSAPSFIGYEDIPLTVSDDPERFRRIDVPGVPHAGLLTSPMFLNRFPTSNTNVNRHRSRMAFKFFLDIDINRFGSRPVDANAVDLGDNPTLNDPNCTVCHTTMDPVAGLFMNWDERGVYRVRGEWYDTMLPPGFGGEDLPRDQYARALQWLAKKLADNPRFAMATVHTMFTGLTGQEPLDLSQSETPAPMMDAGVSMTDGGMPDAGDPMDGGTPDASIPPPPPPAPPDTIPALERAYNVQQGILTIMRDRFVASKHNMKLLVREIVLSPYFRAVNATLLTPDMETELSTFGTSRFLTPEHLTRKIEATTGVRWKPPYDDRDYLLNDYLIFYGGIDSDLVTRRITEPNGVMASLAQRMAYEVACSAVPYDFSKPAGDRVLFPSIEASVRPSDDPARVREAIRYLQERLIGDEVSVDDEEITATFDVLMEAWNLGKLGLSNGSVSEQLADPCRLYRDRITNNELPPNRYLANDPDYIIRAWMAAVSYMLSDYRFLYE